MCTHAAHTVGVVVEANIANAHVNLVLVRAHAAVHSGAVDAQLRNGRLIKLHVHLGSGSKNGLVRACVRANTMARVSVCVYRAA